MEEILRKFRLEDLLSGFKAIGCTTSDDLQDVDVEMFAKADIALSFLQKKRIETLISSLNSSGDIDAEKENKKDRNKDVLGVQFCGICHLPRTPGHKKLCSKVACAGVEHCNNLKKHPEQLRAQEAETKKQEQEEKKRKHQEEKADAEAKKKSHAPKLPEWTTFNELHKVTQLIRDEPDWRKKVQIQDFWVARFGEELRAARQARDEAKRVKLLEKEKSAVRSLFSDDTGAGVGQDSAEA